MVECHERSVTSGVTIVRLVFSERQGKGDHTIFDHPLLPRHYAVDGKDGMDAQRYDEVNLRDALNDLEQAKRKQP